MASRELKVEIIGDASSLHKALGKATDSSSKFGGALKSMGKVAALGVGAAFVGLAATLKVGFEELAEGQKVMAQTEAVLKSTAGAANITSKEVEGLASSLSEMSGVDDEVIQSGENMLLTFKNIRNETGKGNDIFNQTTATLLDMSTALGTDMNKSAIQLGKALNDPIKGISALARVGVTFTEGQKEMIKGMVEAGDTMGAQKLILKELNSEFGGSAKAFGETMPGQLAKLRNAFEEIAGRVAERFLPVLERLLNWVNANMPQIEKVVDSVMDALGRGASIAAGVVQRNLAAIKAAFATTFTTALDIAKRLVSFFQTDFGRTLGIGLAAVLALKTGMGALGVSIGGVGKALMVLKANPMWALLIPLGLLVGELVGNFVESKIAAANLAAAMDKAAGSARGLKDSLDALKDADLSAKEAKLAHTQATLRLAEAQALYSRTVKESGKGSAEAKSAFIGLREATLGLERADLSLTEATKRQTDAHAARNAKLAEGKQALFQLTSEAMRANDTFAQTSTQQKWYESVRKVGDEAAVTALKTKNMGDEAGSRSAAKVALLSAAAVTLAEKLHRVPTMTEIIAEAKARNFPQFYAKLLEVQEKMAGTAESAGSSGHATGSNFGAGLNEGLSGWIGSIASTAAGLVRAAEEAARREAASKSPSQLFARVGEDLVLGLIKGIDENSPAVSNSFKLIAEAMGIHLKAGESALGSFNTAKDETRDNIAALGREAPGTFDAIKKALEKTMPEATSALIPFRSMLGEIVGAFQGVVAWGREALGTIKAVGKAGGTGDGVFHPVGPNFPKMAEGGIIRRPTMVLAGERGPEAIVPLPSKGLGGGVNLTFTFPNYVGSRHELQAAMQQAAGDWMRNNGSSLLPG